METLNAKQESIKKAYAEYWEYVKNNIDENGYLNEYFLSKNSKTIFNKPEIKNKIFGLRYSNIPKSLIGIETNNGWIRIESEDDLPKEDYGFYHVTSKEPIYVKEPKNQSVEEYCSLDINKKKWWMDNITHYRPIEKPKKPIY